MPQYGEVRVDYITYTTGVVPDEGNRTVTVSSLIGSPTFTGDVIISGNTFISGQLDVSGNVIFDQNLNVSGDTTLNNLTVTGIAFVDELYVSGDTTVTGNVGISGNTDIRGDLTVTGTSQQLGDAQFGGDVRISGITTISGDLYVDGTISGATDGGVNGSGYWKIPSGTSAERPAGAGNVRAGMIRYNTTLDTYEGFDGSEWGPLGGGATGSGTDRVFVLNEQTVNTTYTIPDEMNATSCGPITIIDTAEVIIGDGENWSIV